LVGGGPEAFGQTRPTVLVAPYFLAERIAGDLARLGAAGGALQRRARAWALGTAVREFRRTVAGGAASWRGRLARRLGIAEAREVLGGELRLVVASGEAPARLACDLLGALGAPVKTLYAVVEAGGPVAVDGVALDGVEVQIADDGHVLVRGAARWAGYLKEPGLTDRRLLGGWLRSGDRGEMVDGRLRLLGSYEAERGLLVRVTAPDVEAALRDQPAIGQVLALPGRPWLVLVVPAASLIAEVCGRLDIPAGEALTDPRVEDSVAKAIATYNAAVDFEARASDYAIVPQLAHDPLGRLDRAGAQAACAAAIEAAVAAGDPFPSA
ncbi:MAG: AMP-binding protein, partial [Candidatus Sericytochromatia bacterium]|nr:AMP-binding protein [Candidatus Tanganyikabacteria bacterium]